MVVSTDLRSFNERLQSVFSVPVPLVVFVMPSTLPRSNHNILSTLVPIRCLL